MKQSFTTVGAENYVFLPDGEPSCLTVCTAVCAESVFHISGHASELSGLNFSHIAEQPAVYERGFAVFTSFTSLEFFSLTPVQKSTYSLSAFLPENAFFSISSPFTSNMARSMRSSLSRSGNNRASSWLCHKPNLQKHNQTGVLRL